MAGFFNKVREASEAALDSYIYKSRSLVNPKERNESTFYDINRKAFVFDENINADDVGFRSRPSAVTFEVLRQMASRNVIIAAIIQNYVSHGKRFAEPQPDKYTPGFKFVLRDSEAHPSKEDKAKMKEMEAWLLNTGNEDKRALENRMSFSDFLTRSIRDILRFDQLAIEKIHAMDGSLAYFLPVDSGTVHFASKQKLKDKNLPVEINANSEAINDADRKILEEITTKDEKRTKEGDEDYKYVQVQDGQLKRGFFEDELIVRMFNPLNDITSHGYSVGPLEYLANIVSYHLFAEAHNRLFFVQGHASRGILHIEGEVPRDQVEAFRKQWREQVTNATNSWRTPVFAGGNKLNWISLNANNRDMEWSAWMEYLIKLMCALYGISPQEINFEMGKNHTMNESGEKVAQVLKDAHNRGLKPLLSFIQDVINENLIKEYDLEYYTKYKFVFSGIDAESRQEELDRQEKESKIWKTINEIRAEHDFPPLKEGGDIICNKEFTEWYTQFSKEAIDKAEKFNGMNQGQWADGEGPKKDPSDTKEKPFKPNNGSKPKKETVDISKSENSDGLLRVEVYKI